MEIFLICLLALIGLTALIGIMMAIKILRFIERNKEKTVEDISSELKTRFMHFFLMMTYFTILCLVYIITSVFMK